MHCLHAWASSPVPQLLNRAHVPLCRYHPIGFAYIAGGAHTSCKDTNGVAGECPELGGEAGGTTIQYYVGGVAVTSDESGFGLDAYEPLFFNSQGWWGEQTAFKATLAIPADATYTRIYYFCHIHAGMSAEIEITGSTATTTTVINVAALGGETEATALAVFTGIQASDQQAIAAFDETCGTHDATAFDPDSAHSTCSGKNFLCGAGADDTYGKCLKAVDCKMHHDMAVSVPSTSTSKFATFVRQMIPHHQNAVSMTKVLTKHHTAADYPAAGTEDQDQAFAEDLARDIINVQNRQIQQMSAWLEGNTALSGVSTQCYADESSWSIGSMVETSVGSHTVAAGTMQSGEACTPNTTLALKWNSYASEWGAYEVTGCAGVNPKLSLAAGTTYTFDQSDASNWCAPRAHMCMHMCQGSPCTACMPGPPALCPSCSIVRTCRCAGTTRSASPTSRAARTRSARTRTGWRASARSWAVRLAVPPSSTTSVASR